MKPPSNDHDVSCWLKRSTVSGCDDGTTEIITLMLSICGWTDSLASEVGDNPHLCLSFFGHASNAAGANPRLAPEMLTVQVSMLPGPGMEKSIVYSSIIELPVTVEALEEIIGIANDISCLHAVK